MTVSFAPLPPALGPAPDEPDGPVLPALPPASVDGEAAEVGGTAPGVATTPPAPAHPSSASPRPAPRHRGGSGPGHPAPAAPGPKLPRIQRPTGLGAAARPGDVPEPQHHHLPGWVRRIHGQARPVLADLLGSLAGESRERFAAQVQALVDGISSGKFSLAWQYPALIEAGWAQVERSRREAEAEARRRQGVESARRRLAEQLREAGERLTPEAAGRLRRTLQSAPDVGTIRSVGSELDHAISSSRTVEERRRDREIDRTRERLRRSLPQGTVEEQPAESWQDALRRIAEQVTSR